jgi:hypothetical protein
MHSRGSRVGRTAALGLRLDVERREDPSPRVAVAVDLGHQALGGAVVARLQIREHEPLFAAEQVVQRRLGDAGAVQDPFYADGLDAFGVEEFVGGGQQTFPGRRGGRGPRVIDFIRIRGA